MKAYWMRLAGAFVLLKAAAALMKDAEKLLAANIGTRTIEAEVIATEYAETNGQPDVTDMEVEDALEVTEPVTDNG